MLCVCQISFNRFLSLVDLISKILEIINRNHVLMEKLLVLCLTLSFNNNRIIVALYLPSDWVSNIMRRSYFRIKLLRIMQSMGILLPANGFRYNQT
jgi:hypothetical protein